jgi:hypothetical protein
MAMAVFPAVHYATGHLAKVFAIVENFHQLCKGMDVLIVPLPLLG